MIPLVIIGMMFLLLILNLLLYLSRGIRCMRIFGWELTSVLCAMLVLTVVIALVVIPMRAYKLDPRGSSLNTIAAQQLAENGTRVDNGAVNFTQTAEANFFIAALCTYQIDGVGQTSLLVFERNWIGRLKIPRIYPIVRNEPITFVQPDGWFGKYLIEAGRGSAETTYDNENVELTFASVDGYYLRAVLTERPWLGDIINWILLVITLSLANYFFHRDYRAPIHMHESWQSGDSVLQVEYHKRKKRDPEDKDV